MGLTVKTAPASEPLTTAEAKLHCRIDADETEENDYIDGLVKAARRWVEQVTWRTLISTTYELRLDHFGCVPLLVPRPPLSSVTHIKYLDLNGTLTTWDSSNYEVDIYGDPGRIRPVSTGSWPSVGAYQNGVLIEYVAGYGASASSVPEELRMAMRMMVAHWYRQREAVGAANMASVPLAVPHLLAPYEFRDERILEYVT